MRGRERLRVSAAGERVGVRGGDFGGGDGCVLEGWIWVTLGGMTPSRDFSGGKAASREGSCAGVVSESESESNVGIMDVGSVSSAELSSSDDDDARSITCT